MSMSEDYIDKLLLFVAYNNSMSIKRLILLIAIVMIPPLHVESYSSTISISNIKRFPIKVFVPADSPAFTVISDISNLLSSHFVGWTLFGCFGLQFLALAIFSDSLVKQERVYTFFIRLYLTLEFAFLTACSIAGTKFAYNMFVTRSAETWSDVVGHALCGFLIFIFIFGATTISRICFLIEQISGEGVSIEKKDENNLEKVVVDDGNKTDEESEDLLEYVY